MSLKVMKVHEIAKLFPIIPAKEMKDLRSDIEANGIVVPILVNKAKDTIIDGRNRWMIANELKLADVPMETFKGKDEDIPNEILSRNIFRRHLNDDQRISLLAKILAPKLEEEATARKTKKGAFGDGKAGAKGSVAAHLAAAGKVSQHKAQQAIKATKAGVVDDVIKGKTTLRKAAGSAPTKKRTKKVATFEDEVWARFDRFMKHWDVTLHRKVKEILRGFLDDKKPAPKAAA
jgi:ParB-like nuclease domain